MSLRKSNSSRGKREVLTEIGHHGNITSSTTSITSLSSGSNGNSPEYKKPIRHRRKLRRTDDDLILLNTPAPADGPQGTRKMKTITKKTKFVETLPEIENVAQEDGHRKMLHARRRIESAKSVFDNEDKGDKKSISGSEISPAEGGKGKRKRRKRGSKKKSSIGNGDIQESWKENDIAGAGPTTSSDSDRNYSRETRQKNKNKRSSKDGESVVESKIRKSLSKQKLKRNSKNKNASPVLEMKLINISNSENDSVEFNIDKKITLEDEEEEGNVDDFVKAGEGNKKTSRQSVHFDIIFDEKATSSSQHQQGIEPPIKTRLGRSSQSRGKLDVNTEINTTFDDKDTDRNEERRLTFELDKSLTNIDVLKSLSDNNNERQLEATAQSSSKKAHTSIKSKNDKIFLIRKKSFITKTPPGGTSTPTLSRKNPLLQEAAASSKNKNPDKSVTRKPSFRTKLPNFTLIHQKAFDKMENLEELTHRRAERAKLLLSGRKPSDSTVKDSPMKSMPKGESKSKKQLIFNTNQNHSIDFKGVSATPTSLVLPKTLQIPTDSEVSSTSTSTSTSKFLQHPKPTVQNSTSSRVAKTPVISKIQGLRPSPSDRNPSSSVSNSVLFDTRGPSPVPKIKPKPHLREGFTRFGFKTTQLANQVTKAEEMRAVIGKSKIQKNNTEEKRKVLKNVRLNRRFELLMNMRKK